MQRVLGLIAATMAAFGSPAAAATPESAAFLLPACRLYLQREDRGQRLRLERGVCIGTVETVLRLHRELRAASGFCPPEQVTLAAAVRIVVAFAATRQSPEAPLYALAIQAFQETWPCVDPAP